MKYTVEITEALQRQVRLKNKEAISIWKKEGIPHPVCGGDFKITCICRGNKILRKFRYADVVSNRFWWKSEFENCDWSRVENAFWEALQIGLQDYNKMQGE